MAFAKYAQFIAASNNSVFDAIIQPGVQAPRAGIYRCKGCGKEIAIAEGHHLPPQNHHEHSIISGPIRWRLIVCANHNPR